MYLLENNKININMVTNIILIIISLSFLLLSGCSKFSVPVHGHFCGPLHPVLKSKDDNEKLKELRSIYPLDDLDILCQEHDFCYLQNGYFNVRCDDNFYLQLNNINFERISKIQYDYCEGYKEILLTHTKGNHMGLIYIGESPPIVLDTLNRLPFLTIQKIGDVAFTAILNFRNLVTNAGDRVNEFRCFDRRSRY
jgi:hypothetical protein